jgi:hypothetical protein
MRMILIVATMLFAMPVQAEPIRLSEMTREDEVAMQRGTPYPDLVCLENLISEIRGYGGPEAEAEFFVEFEASPLMVYSDVAGMTHTCIDGVHTLHDKHADEPLILQIYNLDGEPTMMED